MKSHVVSVCANVHKIKYEYIDMCVNTCTFVCMCVLPGGIDITIVKHIKKSRVLAAEQRALKIKEGTSGKRQVEGNYIYRD